MLKPELVTPVVAYLCSEQCRSTGDIIAAGGGFYTKVQMVEGLGVRFDPGEEIMPERIAESYGEITNMEGAVPFKSAKDELMSSLGPLMERT